MQRLDKAETGTCCRFGWKHRRTPSECFPGNRRKPSAVGQNPCDERPRYSIGERDIESDLVRVLHGGVLQGTWVYLMKARQQMRMQATTDQMETLWGNADPGVTLTIRQLSHIDRMRDEGKEMELVV